jgi:hypothetical protein
VPISLRLEDGTVTYAKGTQENLQKLAQAEVMGFTLPHRFGGLNFPNLVYSMAIEIVSRADAALMNIFGLQGIAETINAFSSEEIKQQYLHDFSAGKVTGAMVLTEPDAGSDLQAIKVSGHDAEKEQPAAVYQDAERRQLVRSWSKAIHHERVRRDTFGFGAERAGDCRRTGAESVSGRARSVGEGPPAGGEARHSRFADV